MYNMYNGPAKTGQNFGVPTGATCHISHDYNIIMG